MELNFQREPPVEYCMRRQSHNSILEVGFRRPPKNLEWEKTVYHFLIFMPGLSYLYG